MTRTTPRAAGALLLAAWLAALAGCSWDTVTGSHQEERAVEVFSDSTATAGLAALSVETENGSIEVTASTADVLRIGMRVEVRAASLAQAEAFASEVTTQVERDGDELRLYYEHPDPPRGVTVVVDYEVECPAGLAVALVGVNGSVEVEGLSGPTSILLVNGNVDFSGRRGPLAVVTVNGNIAASLADLSSAGSFVTVNGSIDVSVESGVGSLAAQCTNGTVAVHLHAGFGARLDARVERGQIRSGVALSAVQVSDLRLQGTIGPGGSAEVELRVTNGDIEIDTL